MARTRRLNIALDGSARQHACSSEADSPHGETSLGCNTGEWSEAALGPEARSTQHVHRSSRVATASAASFSVRTTNLKGYLHQWGTLYGPPRLQLACVGA
jgi:hypothetical protein